MKILGIAALVFWLLGPCPALAQSTAMPLSKVGSGPNGYDWLIGTWSCANGMPASPTSGPPTSTLTVSRSQGMPGLFARITGEGLDATGYLSFDAKTQTWRNPVSVGNGSASNESTRQTGARTVWTGSAIGDMGRVPMRDTYVLPNITTYVDTTEMRIGGAWKTISKITCKKT